MIGSPSMHSGELIFHFLNTIVLTALIAAWVLWRYRAAVLRGMQARAARWLRWRSRSYMKTFRLPWVWKAFFTG